MKTVASNGSWYSIIPTNALIGNLIKSMGATTVAGATVSAWDKQKCALKPVMPMMIIQGQRLVSGHGMPPGSESAREKMD